MIKVLLADKLSPQTVELQEKIPKFDMVEHIGLPADLHKQKIQERAGADAVSVLKEFFNV